MYRLESQSVAFFVFWARRKVDLFFKKISERTVFLLRRERNQNSHTSPHLRLCRVPGQQGGGRRKSDRGLRAAFRSFKQGNRYQVIFSTFCWERGRARLPTHPPPVHFFCIFLFFLGGREPSRCEHLSAVFHGFLCWWEITEFSRRSNRGRFIARSNVQKRTWDKIQPRVDL